MSKELRNVLNGGNVFDISDMVFSTKEETVKDICDFADMFFKAVLNEEYKNEPKAKIYSLVKNSLTNRNDNGWFSLVGNERVTDGDAGCCVISNPTYATLAMGTWILKTSPEMFDADTKKAFDETMELAFRNGICAHGCDAGITRRDVNLMFSRAKGNTVPVFVYGTLMEGERAHNMIDGADYQGRYALRGYGMYNLGSYPRIKPVAGETVIGEVYLVSEEMLRAMDLYEGEGSLYRREKVTVERKHEKIEAYAYIYMNPVSGETMGPEWNTKADDYVWYACYGTNLSSERFSYYIKGGVYEANGKEYKGCRNKKRWIATDSEWFAGRLYFAKNSGSWEGMGVAFYDSSSEGRCYMKMYKITRGQLMDVQDQEGPTWYDRMECLGLHYDDCPIYTLTGKQVYAQTEPSGKMLEVMKKELKKTLGAEEKMEEYIKAAKAAIRS